MEPVDAFLERLPRLDLSSRVSDASDPALLKMARLDCDWHAENARAFSAMTHPHVSFGPASVLGVKQMLEFLQLCRQKPAHETWWLLFMGQHPQTFAGTWGKLGPMLSKLGVKLFYYAFDEASRTMQCFGELAPHLDVLVHDESPLAAAGEAGLRNECLRVHRSWVANCIPFSTALVENPIPGIIFLGSKLGLTAHRHRQIDFLKIKFKDRFHSFHDHSVPVGERDQLNRYKVSLCPEGRKFATPAMHQTHTDRPFWSGCLGMVPVSEDSAAGGRLEELHQQGLILRYGHGNLASLEECCERALAMDLSERQRIYLHFNREETVGTVVASQMAAAVGGR